MSHHVQTHNLLYSYIVHELMNTLSAQVAVQNALKEGVIDSVITHAPGHMFISDLTVAESQKLPCLGATNPIIPMVPMRVMNAKL